MSIIVQYPCPECPLLLSTRQNMFRHLQTVHSDGARQNICGVCNCSFTRGDNLMCHIWAKHQVAENSSGMNYEVGSSQQRKCKKLYTAIIIQKHDVCRLAARYGHLVLEYAFKLDKSCLFRVKVCRIAFHYGYLDIFKFADQHGCQ